MFKRKSRLILKCSCGGNLTVEVNLFICSKCGTWHSQPEYLLKFVDKIFQDGVERGLELIKKENK